MSDPQPLFDVDRTTAKACPVPGCGAIRLPGQKAVLTCDVDLERARGDWTRRPQGCLNTIYPEHNDIPY